MKCPYCGNSFTEVSDKCPYCDATIYSVGNYPNKTAEFLDKHIRLGTFDLINRNLILIIVINICILSFIANGITFYALHNPTVWCQYNICGTLSAYVLLKGIAANRLRTLVYVRRAIYILLLGISVVDFAYGNSLTGILYIYPILLIFLSLSCFILLLSCHTSRGSFGITSFIDMALSSVPLFVIRFTDVTGYPWGVLLSYISFGVATLIFVNYLIISLMSSISNLKKHF